MFEKIGYKATILIGVFLILRIFIPSTSNAQLKNSPFNNYSINEGLSDNVVHCIFQDSKGWIWIGTSFGILRFDGYSFVKLQFYGPESEALGKTLVRTIFEDKDGVLWIGTENQGIFLYDRKIFELTQIKIHDAKIPIPNNSIWSIAAGNGNSVWIGTEKGLLYFDKSSGKSRIYSNSAESKPAISNNFIRALYVDSGKNVWIGTNEGIDLLNLNTNVCKNYLKNEATNERENEVWKIYKSHDGQIWVGTYLDGLKRYNSKLDKFESFDLVPKNERARTVHAIVEDNSGN
jgi:ligand-binding sensor domain-containing protein